jgi:iron only hydrogenase large subunit-like protein
MFSGTVQIGDIDDFIGPGTECTKPVELEKPKKGVVRRTRRNKDGSYVGGDGTPLKKAKITLADCLACSGCVTSAETVLITQQSLDEFLSVISKAVQRVIVTISPQSRVSLAHRFNHSGL